MIFLKKIFLNEIYAVLYLEARSLKRAYISFHLIAMILL